VIGTTISARALLAYLLSCLEYGDYKITMQK